MSKESKIRELLKEVYDPELNCNIIDLGLVYDIDFPEEGQVKITMTLTTPGCPMHDAIVGGVKHTLLNMPGITEVDVDLVWEPAWSPEHMTQAAKEQLGYF